MRCSDFVRCHRGVWEQPRRGVAGRPHRGPRYLLGGAVAVTVFLMFLAGEVATVSAQAARPSAPTGLSGTLHDDHSVALDWADTSGATSYQLAYRHFHVSAWVDLPVTGVTVTVTGSQAMVSGLPAPLNYYFRVRASNSEGSSDWSEEALVTPAPIVGGDGCTIEAPPAPLASFDKYCSAGGVGVVGSAGVADFALKLAWNQIMNMLAAHPTVHQLLAEAGAHHQVTAASESPQSPRYRSTTRHSRAPEANLLCYLDSFPYNYSFLVHEFAHAIYDAGLPDAERQEVTAAYNAAMEAGLWENKYARNSDKEYWAEAVEAYFSGATRGINFNHEEMAEHDSRIYEVLLRYLPANGWRVSCPHSSEAPPPPAKPPAPVNLRATTVTQTNVTLTWEVPPGEEGNVQRYHIVRSDDEVQSWWVIATIPADRTTFAVTGLTPDYLYSFAIRAGNGYRETIGPWEGVRTSPSVYRLSGETDIMRSEHSGPFVAHYTAPDLDAATLTFSLAGADAGRFEMSGGGQLSFRVAPDYESPADADRDNVYNVTVQARDGSHAISLDVTVTVANVEETGTLTLGAGLGVNGEALVATLEDPDVVATQTWVWQRRTGTSGAWTDIANTDSNSYTPGAADVGNYLRARVTYTDGAGTEETTLTVATESPTLNDASTNQPPTPPDPLPQVAAVPEDAPAGRNVVQVVFTDPEGEQQLTYSLISDEFAIGSGSGRITVKSGELNYEETTSYSVTVSAADSYGAAGMVTLRIPISDVNEPPGITFSESSGVTANGNTLTVDENHDGALATFGASDPGEQPEPHVPVGAGGDRPLPLRHHRRRRALVSEHPRLRPPGRREERLQHHGESHRQRPHAPDGPHRRDRHRRRRR